MPIGQQAVELLRKALSIAEEQGAKLWELPATTSLARPRRDQGRHAEARDFLAPVAGSPKVLMRPTPKKH